MKPETTHIEPDGGTWTHEGMDPETIEILPDAGTFRSSDHPDAGAEPQCELDSTLPADGGYGELE